MLFSRFFTLGLLASLLLAGWGYLPQGQAAQSFLVMDKAITIQADTQTYDANKQRSNFNGHVVITSGGMTIRCQQGHVLLDANNQPQQAFFSGDVVITKASDTLTAPQANFNFVRKLFTAEGGVQSTTHAQGGSSPTVVNSAVQKFDQLSNQLYAQGNVRIRTQETTAQANEALLVLNAQQQAERLKLIGNAHVQQPTGTVKAQLITLEPQRDLFTAEGQAHSVFKQANKKPIVLDSQFQQFDKPANQLLSSGRVYLEFEQYVARGPKATFYFKPSASGSTEIDHAVFVGRSTIREALRQVTGDVITITANPQYFDARGNVKTILVQEKKKEQATTAPVAQGSTRTKASVATTPPANPALAVAPSHRLSEEEEFTVDRFQ
ncbi:MAG: LptA/OstA family protein [Vampirovibrionales bacterium]